MDETLTTTFYKGHHIISKKLFCKVINFMRNQTIRYETLNKAMSALCPGFMVNFYPDCEYNTIIINILNEMFGYTDDKDSMIDYFIFELEYGTNEMTKSLSVDISTPEKLYDFLIEQLPDLSASTTSTTTKKPTSTKNKKESKK